MRLTEALSGIFDSEDAEGRYISRPPWKGKAVVQVRIRGWGSADYPTFNYGSGGAAFQFGFVTGIGMSLVGWSPSAEDLLADDWVTLQYGDPYDAAWFLMWLEEKEKER